jgi:hypothetical protein
MVTVGAINRGHKGITFDLPITFTLPDKSWNMQIFKKLTRQHENFENISSVSSVRAVCPHNKLTPVMSYWSYSLTFATVFICDGKQHRKMISTVSLTYTVNRGQNLLFHKESFLRQILINHFDDCFQKL